MRPAWLLILLIIIPLAAVAQLEPLSIPAPATELLPVEASGQPAAPAGLPPAQRKLVYSLLIENRTGGVIRIIEPPAQYLLNRPGVDIGSVLHPVRTLQPGDPATRNNRSWPHVTDCALDRVSLTLDPGRPGTAARGIELLPSERNFQAAAGGFEQPLPTALYTDIHSGYGIFGGAFPLIPGNPVSIVRGHELIGFDDPAAELEPGDFLVVEVNGPAQWPLQLEIPNTAGGVAKLQLADGQSINCAVVTSPLTGVPPPAPRGSGFRSGVIFTAGTGGIGLSCLPAEPAGFLELRPLPPLLPAVTGPIPEATIAAPGITLTGTGGAAALGQPPVFDGYLYPRSGLEVQLGVPRIEVSVQLTGFDVWQPLSSLIVPEALANIALLRFSWLPALEDSALPAASGLDPAAPVTTPDGAPSLRQ